MRTPAYQLPFAAPERQERVDWLMLAALGGLMAVGAFFVYSATMVSEAAATIAWYNQPWVRQVIWYALGGVALGIVCLVDYRVLSRWSIVIYWGTILLLIAVLIPGLGSTQGWGARRWIDLGFFSIQPSEFAKLGFIVAMANFLSRPPDELKSVRIFWQALGMTVLPFLLILREPDLGSALILLPVGLTMLFVAGVPPRYINTLIGVSSLLVVLILVDVLFAPPQWQIKLEAYQKRRLLVYFGLDGAPRNASPAERAEARRVQRDYSYNVDQALISVGSGGLTGKGWRQGTQNALGYLPRSVAHNDFIFSVLAEEQGFAGVLVALGLYLFVILRSLEAARLAKDRFGSYLVLGVLASFTFQVVYNITMSAGLAPVKGLTLPLMSYGGSSMIATLAAFGLVLNVRMRRFTN